MLRFCLAVVALAFASATTGAEPPRTADLVKQLETGPVGERAIAAQRIGDLGSAAADAIPALTRVATDALRASNEGDDETRRANKHLYRAAIDALVGIGPKSVPALAELLPGEKDDNFGPIAWELQSFGRDAAPAAPALAKLLADDNQDFRVRVAGILEEIGPGAEPAIPALIDLFFNPKNANDGRFGSGPMPPPPRVAAVRALVRIGPKGVTAITDNVLPALLEELRTGEHRPGGSSFEVLSVLGETGATLAPALVDVIKRSETKFERTDAVRALLGLGATGREEFGKLLAGPDAKVRRDMVAALNGYLLHERYPTYYRFDAAPLDIAPFVPALVKALKDAEPEHRLAAAAVLCKLGDKAPPEIVEAIAALFADPAVKKLVEEGKGWLLGEPNFNAFGEPGVRVLVQLLDSDSLAVRKFAVGQLGYSPRKWSETALPRLRKLAEHADAKLAGDAAYVAAKLSLDPKDASAVAPRRFVLHSDWVVRDYAAHHLQWLGPLGVPHLEAIIPLLDDKDDKVVQAAAKAIYYRAPKGSAAARALTDRRLVQDKRYRFVVTFEAPAEPAPPGVPELVRSLTTGDSSNRATAALDLGDRGAAAKDAVPALKKLLTDPDPDLRFAAGYVLARIENDPRALRQLLTGEFERAARGRPIAWSAAKAFERLPPDYPELIPLVVRWLERDREHTVLVDGLVKYGPKAKDAVPALRKVLRGPGFPIHGYLGAELKPACEALGAIGPDARAALPELRELLDTRDVELALAARDAIRKIEGGK